MKRKAMQPKGFDPGEDVELEEAPVTDEEQYRWHDKPRPKSTGLEWAVTAVVILSALVMLMGIVG